MSAEVVNLRRFRKQAERRDREATAAENRRAHGQTRAERESARNETDMRNRVLDGSRLQKPDADEA